MLARPRVVAMIFFAGLLIAVNWGVYIYGVNSDQVVESSLGYFINPLVTVLMGVLVLGERLRRLQWIAVGIAALAVVVLTVGYGKLPWIGLVLAFSFAGYGLIKKVAGVDPQASLTLETAFMTPFALAYLVYLQIAGPARALPLLDAGDRPAHGRSVSSRRSRCCSSAARPTACR